MKILVLMKQVANKDAILRLNKDATWIEEADLSFEVNESDGYALEEALRIKESRGARTAQFTLSAIMSFICHRLRQQACWRMPFAERTLT